MLKKFEEKPFDKAGGWKLVPSNTWKWKPLSGVGLNDKVGDGAGVSSIVGDSEGGNVQPGMVFKDPNRTRIPLGEGFSFKMLNVSVFVRPSPVTLKLFRPYSKPFSLKEEMVAFSSPLKTSTVSSSSSTENPTEKYWQ
jgi:hypothetical protein